jgi:predicted membrane channel-forming protein YqfA (hemolysin III family)
MIWIEGHGATKATCSFFREVDMTLKAPKQITFWIAVVIAVVGIILKLVVIPPLSGHAGWVELIAFVVLALGVLIKGL